MKRLYLCILIVAVLLFSACQSSIPNVATKERLVQQIEITTQPKSTQEIKVISIIKPTEMIEETPLFTSEPTNTEETIVIETTKSTTPITAKETVSTTPQPKETPTSTPAPTDIPTPSPSPTHKPTEAPEYTVISSQIRSGALEGINEAREEEGYSPASLSSTLNAKAEAHAIEMAKSNSLYHSSMGYIESVRSGAFIGGWAEGYGAANHATGLCLEADVVSIGVGCAKSSDGTVYTCIIGTR